MGIDILPAELPVESSQFFSNALYPFIKDMVHQSADAPLEALSPLLRNAAITEKGRLREAHRGLEACLPSSSKITKNGKKTVLLLGSGMVAGPLVEHLARRNDTHLVVGKYTYVPMAMYHLPLFI